MTVGIALLVAALVLRGVSVSRHVRGRLLGSVFIFAAYAIAGAAVTYAPGDRITPDMLRLLREVQPLLFAFGVINAVVALTLNPLRADRISDRFPTIVQDTIVIMVFALAAVFVLQDRMFATTAVGAVVIGFALQDTLGNLFAGLAIQVEKPFRVGHWVNVAGTDGLVSEITWRATKLRTKSGNFVVVPNNTLSKDTIVNYSEPIAETRIEVEVGASYDSHPNDVKRVILDAIKGEPLISGSRPSEVLLVEFAASAITYRARVWTTDFAGDEQLRDRMRVAIYYAFKRHQIVIPYPIQVGMAKEDLAAAQPDSAAAESVLRAVEIFGTLTDDQRRDLARAARRSTYAAGEAVVRQGEAGSSMFVVMTGEAVVKLTPTNQEVARVKGEGFFGEMSLLTGAPRTATVVAAVDSELLEITADAFRTFVLANPTVMEQIGAAMTLRQAELEQHRAAGANLSGGDEGQSFLTRVRRFLRLTTSSAGR